MLDNRASGKQRSRLGAVQDVLAPVPFFVVGIGLLIYLVGGWFGTIQTDTIVLPGLGVFFPLLLVRLALAAFLLPDRRTTLVLLLAAIISWAIGSISVNTAIDGSKAQFPADGEWLFMLSYLGMAGYLVRDIDRRQSRPARAWLDIVIICGGTACLACLLLVTPVRVLSHQEGVPLLLALIYPLADVILALLVLGQGLLQMRVDRRKSWMLGIGFTLLAAADSAFALQGSARTYDFGALRYTLWAGAFVLIVTAACMAPKTVIKVVPQIAGTPVLVGAGILALAVLAFRPDDTVASYMLPPAILTLTAVAMRMALALRDANRANEAFALSETDDLTKLPNRRAVRAWLAGDLAARRPMSLMLLDLDGFKEINDSLGHRAGDTVLTMVAVRIREAVGPRVRVARLGGDEFAIVVAGTDEMALMETAHGVLQELSKPLLVEGIELSLGASIGVTVVDGASIDGSEAMRRADVAMYQAKNSGLGVALYDAELDEFSRSRLQLAEDLRKGLSDGQIEVWYQPQLDAATMDVAGLEALVRWRHPLHGVVSPDTFLPAARRAGLMARLSEVVARQAVDDLIARERDGIDLRVAINCAPPELLGPSFLPMLYTLLSDRDVAADRLVLEVTEDSFLADPEHTRDILLALRSHGVQVSIDDYGTGFSSLAYLRNLPVQELKIDQELIGNVATDARSRMIVASTIQLAHALELRIVAEGVENAADLTELVAMGIDTVQGYHLARPMTTDELSRWVLGRTLTAQQPDDEKETSR
ncbi:MAG: bifunctional diguanylate cyclase/phosphodiesterase [Aeromicrobium sp.]